MNVVRVPWTSASFLVYAGGLIVLVAAVWLLTILSDDYDAAAFAGWSALVLALLAACTFAFHRVERPVAAGLFAFSAVAAFAVFVGALEDWFGWLPSDRGLFEGFDVSVLLIALATLSAAATLLSWLHFPLLVAVVAGAAWYFVTDVVSGGGDWSAIVSIAVGAVFLLVALAANEIYAFWWHVAAGLTIGGGLLWFWHTSDTDWILVAIAGLAYIALADRLGRSSWAVLGALGLLMSTTHFVEEWFGFDVFFFLPFAEEPEDGHDWARPISYAVLGLAFVLIGLLIEWRRRGAKPAELAV